MFWKTLLHRPRSLAIRRALFQVHLWIGIGLGAYFLVVSATGAALVFRGEMQHSAHPGFFPAPTRSGTQAPVADVVDRMTAAFPEHRLVGVGTPTDERGTFIGYIYKDGNYRAVFARAETGEVIGALPEDSVLLWLQNLHFYLLSGTTGLMINGIGGLLLVLMCLTGLFIWWPGVSGWKRSIKVDFAADRKQLIWQLHGALGFWTLVLVAMWGVTGAYFAFPQQFRSAVGWFSPLAGPPSPASDVSARGRGPAPALGALIERAESELPGAGVVRISLPMTEAETIQIVLTRTRPAVYENADYVYLYFDRFTGDLLHRRDLADRSAGEALIPWFGRLHVGAFGGLPVKILWLVLGLAPALLFVTGALIWRNRAAARKREQDVRNSLSG